MAYSCFYLFIKIVFYIELVQALSMLESVTYVWFKREVGRREIGESEREKEVRITLARLACCLV